MTDIPAEVADQERARRIERAAPMLLAALKLAIAGFAWISDEQLQSHSYASQAVAILAARAAIREAEGEGS